MKKSYENIMNHFALCCGSLCVTNSNFVFIYDQNIADEAIETIHKDKLALLLDDNYYVFDNANITKPKFVPFSSKINAKAYFDHKMTQYDFFSIFVKITFDNKIGMVNYMNLDLVNA